MQIRETFSVQAPLEAVAELLLDVDAVASCVPGVEGVTGQGDGVYEAVLAVRMGPINARFGGALRLDGSDAPRTLRASGKGRDRSTNSQVAVDMTADLNPIDGGTEVDVLAEVAIRGRLGQFGTGVIQSTASEMTKAFAACLRAKLEAGEPPAGAANGVGADGSGRTTDGAPAPTTRSAQAPPTPQQPSFVRILLHGIWASIRGFLRRLFRRGS